MMLEMRVYIEKRDKTREIEQPDAWFTPNCRKVCRKILKRCSWSTEMYAICMNIS